MPGIVKIESVYYVSREFLEKHGVPYNSIRTYLERNRKGIINSWNHIKAPEDKRKVLIEFGSIPDKTKIKYKLPDGNEIEDHYKADIALGENEAEGNQELQIKDKLHRAITVCYVEYTNEYREVYPGDKETPINKAKLHSLYSMIIELKKNKVKVKSLFSAYSSLHIPHHKKVTSFKSFSRKLVQCQKNGIKSTVVHGRQGKELRWKLDEFVEGKIIQYFSDPRQFSSETITYFVNKEIERYNQERASNPSHAKRSTISESTVKKYLLRPEIKNRVLKYRNPEQYKRSVLPTNRRIKALNAGDTFMLDGTRLQLFCLDKSGKKPIRPNILVIYDVYSSKVVGLNISESEDRFSVMTAMEMAVKMSGFAPREWLYDNASVTKTEEFKRLKNELRLFGSEVRYARVGNAKDKSQIERFFRTFQNKYQRNIPGFLGGGIKSKVETERISSEYLEKVRKEKGLPSFKQLEKTILELIASYNNSVNKSSEIPNELFAKSPKPNVCKLDQAQAAFLFWHHKTLTVRNMEIATKIRKQPYYYDVSDHPDKFKLNGQKVKLYYDIRDLSRVFVFDLKDNRIGELNQKTAFHQSIPNQSEKDIEQIIKNESHIKSIDKSVDTALKEKANRASKAGGSDRFWDVFNPLSDTKERINDAESIAFMNTYGILRDVDFSETDGIENINPDNPLTNPDYGKEDLLTKSENIFTKEATYKEVDQES